MSVIRSLQPLSGFRDLLLRRRMLLWYSLGRLSPARSRRSPIAQSSQLDGRMTVIAVVEDEDACSLSALGMRFKSHEHMRREKFDIC